ncbi:OmpA family protein [Actinomadura mexicana]|uniref:Outer membrane protein OmpA n=1 Tax=Actinomadura mexicana TaxID=134959 RepID=A0A238WYU7_9ACTN|nr:OmpA family protein [Actinomadura mexicana]SNR51394.1 Outer membrane protein OmpA [Actinomadura mexicana]
MSRVRRPAVLAAALALVLAVPAVAGADPGVPDLNLTQSILPIETGASVYGIELQQAVVSLEEEEGDGARVTVRISADVLFDFGKATLTGAARRRIAELAPRLRGARGAVQVAGHSDSVGEPAYNLTLSEQRAEAVKAELAKALTGTSPQIEARGYGETKPVVPNEQGGKDDPAGRAKNRRVEIIYEKG